MPVGFVSDFNKVVMEMVSGERRLGPSCYRNMVFGVDRGRELASLRHQVQEGLLELERQKERKLKSIDTKVFDLAQGLGN